LFQKGIIQLLVSVNSNRPAQDALDERLSAMELHSGKREAQ